MKIAGLPRIRSSSIVTTEQIDHCETRALIKRGQLRAGPVSDLEDADVKVKRGGRRRCPSAFDLAP